MLQIEDQHHEAYKVKQVSYRHISSPLYRGYPLFRPGQWSHFETGSLCYLRHQGSNLSSHIKDRVSERCIVHQVRNPLKYMADKDHKPFSADLKIIYQAPTEEKAVEALGQITNKWNGKYPNSMKSWKQNRDAISPSFKFSSVVHRVIYTTNAIESLNATYRKLDRQRSVFPSDTALLKALYLSIFEATKNWMMPIRNW